jgi:hypothetical protein
MSTSSDDAKALATDVLAPDAVAAFLERNPAFLNDRPALISVLVPPEFDRGKGVVDMQSFMLDRLRGQLAQARAREESLLEAAAANAQAQQRVHGAIEALLAARSFEGLIRTIVEELPGRFDVSAAALCIETDKPLPKGAASTGLVVLPPGALDRIGEVDQPVVLRADTRGDKVIFGARASKVRSMALMQLNFGTRAPRGMLVLGASAPDAFDPSQSTDLLAFFAFVLQRCVRRWLNDGP